LSQIVRFNESVQLTCEAAVHPSLDFTYIWELNGFPIDLDFNEDWRLKRYRNLEKYRRVSPMKNTVSNNLALFNAYLLTL
jgi:hypothetical protein